MSGLVLGAGADGFMLSERSTPEYYRALDALRNEWVLTDLASRSTTAIEIAEKIEI
jgi:hypothetical protein